MADRKKEHPALNENSDKAHEDQRAKPYDCEFCGKLFDREVLYSKRLLTKQ